jgi:hypothetical protein
MPDTGFVLRGEETSTRGNGRRAGVAQSVAQLSCKQQVRGSSPLASSIIRSLDRSEFHRSFTACSVRPLPMAHIVEGFSPDKWLDGGASPQGGLGSVRG